MLTRTLFVVGVAAASSSLLLAPAAIAAPTADAQGYVDSTARCAPPKEAVLFGATGSSRVAICKTSDGEYEYRGVRLRDGAKLIVPATQTGDEFTAENDGITYFVSEESLTISAGTRVIREEPMVDVHEGQADDAPSAPPPASTPKPTKPLPPPLPAEEGHTGT
ncbi:MULTISPECIES: hypothetical protein [unclassified Mycobacterium]|uniref:hypothetical protein n=1 Tax=unclassified Mycobacterium TaxID=2642494 RepID=UPI0007405100|nr:MULTISPECIES: hypothetical protein [unclassified Mycobacterium]KUH80347.1 hypothetical protein AU185_12925 [Mycobacterium sp. GA-0227b]KUH81901.1 hypothetical protein AU186_12500 [Mycobacterium sp. GA-1999]KUH93495.1 hypothetical protein AU187_11910 [Mycobacterium sp. IS-1556]